MTTRQWRAPQASSPAASDEKVMCTMGVSPSWEEQAEQLAKSRDDLLLTAAALQLTPDNQTKWARFVRLTELAHVIGPSEGDDKVSTKTLRTILTRAPLADPDAISAEDPSEEPFVSCIQFFGGNFRVVSGGVTGAHVGCQLVLDATRMMKELGHDEFEMTVFLEAQVLLSLSEEACRRANLARYAAPTDRGRSSLVIPDLAILEELRRAVTFTPDECRRLAGADLSDVVQSLTLDSRIAPPDDERESPVDDRLYALPLARTRGGDVCLAVPGGVAMCIVHRALVNALAAGIADDFVTCLRRAQLSDLHQALAAMNWERVGAPDRLDPPTGFDERFYRFDIDKVAHVCSVVDTLDGYEPGRPFDHAPMSTTAAELRARLPAVREALRVMPDQGSVLHLVALAPLGRSQAMAVAEGSIDSNSALLVSSLGDLVVMSSEVDGDPLGLWAFAQARRRLHAQVHVVSFCALDEFAIYKGHSDGFYLGDDKLPMMMSVQSDTAAPMRISTAQRRDVHAALLPDEGGVALVERWPASNEQEVYRPSHRKLHGHHVVEIESSVWVVPADVGEEGRDTTDDMLEVIAYWIWRCRDLLSSPLHELSQREIRPVIEVAAELPDPRASSDLEPVHDWLRVDFEPPGRVLCHFGSEAGGRFQGPGNSAERLIARQIVSSFYRLAGLTVPAEEAWPAVLRTDSLVKMLHVLGPDADPVLTLGLGSLPRLVRPSAVEVILVQIGEELNRAGFVVGEIDPPERTMVLNSAVSWAFHELWQLLQAVNPAGLLEALASETESIIYAERRARLQIPSQVACFGADSAAVARSKTHLTGMAATAVANRFLIEMATASPSNGREPLSLGSYDRLIALGSRIVEFGFLSDAIQYGLSDERMALLPSGRLGFDRVDAYQTAFANFGKIVSARSVESAVSAYPSHWQSRSSRDYDPSEIDNAYDAEFGISATQVGLVLGDLVNDSRNADNAVAVRDLAELHGALQESTGLDEDAVTAGLALLTLKPIDGFDPDRVPRDSYPWKFSRDRSMIRRPLLVRPSASGQEVVWGARTTWRAGRYLLGQLMSGRYPARSAPMQKFVGRTTQEAGKEFNARVAEAFRELGFDDVREQVDKIGKLRLLRSNGQAIGDVDVFIVDRTRRVLLAVEAKDFELARTPQELANEVEKLISDAGSASTHHLERVNFLRTRLARVLNELKIVDDPARWEVQSMVVTSADLLGTHYLAASGRARELRLTSLDELVDRSRDQIVASHRKNPDKVAKRQRSKKRKRRQP